MNFVPASPTSLGTFQTCPRQFQAKYITKEVVFQPTEASLYGDRAHKALEARLKFGTPLPMEFAGLESLAAQVAARGGELLVEEKLAVDRTGAACQWRDRYIGGIADWLVVGEDTAHIGDWKTGKPKTDPLQLQILTLATFAKYPQVQRVKAGLIFFKSGDVFRLDTRRGEISLDTLSTEMVRYEYAQRNGLYPERPNGLCRQWCQVTACPFHGKGR